MNVNWFKIGIGVFLILTFLYAFLFASQVLVWFAFVLAAYLLYLVVRLVRAVETIAENSNRPETDTDE